MITLRNLILESALYEDDEAKQKGWKHIAFGTYEDPSGKRYRRDDSGNWKEVGSDTTSTGTMGDYESRVSDLESQGMTRSDAQGVADLEFEKKYGKGWETGGTSEKQSQIKSLDETLSSGNVKRVDPEDSSVVRYVAKFGKKTRYFDNEESARKFAAGQTKSKIRDAEKKLTKQRPNPPQRKQTYRFRND